MRFLRAQRFALHEPVRYRPLGAARWRLGRIENISCSGVLFWSHQPLEVETPLEMSITLPVGFRRPSILCRGWIVRTQPAPRRGAGIGLAATIVSYRWLRRGRRGLPFTTAGKA